MPKKIKKYKAKKKKDAEIDKNEESASSGFDRYGRPPRRERTPEEKKEYKKLALMLIVWWTLVASVYYMFVQIENGKLKSFEETGAEPEFSMMFAVMLVYLILGAALFLVWLIYNGGFKKIDVTKYEKPDDMGYDEFCRFIGKLKERQKKAKYILILFLPFILVLLMDWWIIRLTTDRSAGQAEQTEQIEESVRAILRLLNLI